MDPPHQSCASGKYAVEGSVPESCGAHAGGLGVRGGGRWFGGGFRGAG